MTHFYQIILKTDQNESVWSMRSRDFRKREDRLLRSAERLTPVEKAELDNELYDSLITPCFGRDGSFVYGSPLPDALSEALLHKPSRLLFLSEDIRDIPQLKEHIAPDIVVPQILYTFFRESVPGYDFETPKTPFAYEGKYLLNHEQKLALPLSGRSGEDHPLAVLTRVAADPAVPAEVKEQSKNGSWALRLISVEEAVPEGYTLLPADEAPKAYDDCPPRAEASAEAAEEASLFTTRTRTYGIAMRDLKGRIRLWSLQKEGAREENLLFMNRHAYYGSPLTDAVSRAIYHNPCVLFWKENSLKNIWLIRKGLSERYGVMSLPYIEKTEPKEGENASSSLASRGVHPFDEEWFRTLRAEEVPGSLLQYTVRRGAVPESVRMPHALYPFLECFLGWRQEPRFLDD